LSELPRGTVFVDEALVGDDIDNESTIRSASLANELATLAVGGSYAELETDHDTADPHELISDEAPRVELERPDRPPKKTDANSNRLRLDINVGTRHIDRVISVGNMARLSAETKLLLGVGQINAPKYSCITGSKARHAYIARIINKGLTKENEFSDIQISQMFEEAEEQGLVRRTIRGKWQLTDAGMDSLLDDEKLKRNLKNPGTIG